LTIQDVIGPLTVIYYQSNVDYIVVVHVVCVRECGTLEISPWWPWSLWTQLSVVVLNTQAVPAGRVWCLVEMKSPSNGHWPLGSAPY
jgi:hypothetical protein